MNDAAYSSLRGNVSSLGRLLGETIAAAEGQPFLDLVEQIRQLSKSAREGTVGDREELQAVLHNLGNEQLVPVARAFSQFLNLANIADQHHNVSREADPMLSASHSLLAGLGELLEQGVATESVIDAVRELRIELVLTAHPTEITRRTLIHKHGEIGRCLAQLELTGLTERECERLNTRLRELIAQIWFGDDFRTERPTPVDEAKWGFAVVEDSLWRAPAAGYFPGLLCVLDGRRPGWQPQCHRTGDSPGDAAQSLAGGGSLPGGRGAPGGRAVDDLMQRYAAPDGGWCT